MSLREQCAERARDRRANLRPITDKFFSLWCAMTTAQRHDALDQINRFQSEATHAEDRTMLTWSKANAQGEK